MAKTVTILVWVITAALVLFVAGLGFIRFSPGYSFSAVRSGSMEPAFRTGDVIITGPVAGRVEPGMIIMYQHGSETITHRVISTDGDTLVMKGDALVDSDPWRVTVSDVREKYLFKIPFIGYVLSFIRTRLGWLLAIIIPAAGIVGLLVKDIIMEAFAKGKEQPG